MAEVKKIWDSLLKFIGNPYGVAGLMGNLKAESGLEPVCLEKTYRTKLGMTSAQYVKAVDDGSYQFFEQDGAGFGLAMWTYADHKTGLLTYARYKGQSIGSLDFQLDFLAVDLAKWKYVLNRLKVAKSVQEASDLVLTVYLKPADQSTAVKQKRAKYGQQFYDTYAKGDSGMVKAEDLVKLFKQALADKWGYIWGMYGQLWTAAKQASVSDEMAQKYGSKWIGHHVADCSGLGYWAFKELGGYVYHGSNTMWREYVTQRTEIKNGQRADGQPMLIGDPVFRVKDGSYHHVGYYVGGNKTIEAKGTQNGVIQSTVDKWHATAHWVNVEYPGGVIYRVRPTLRKGSQGMDVRDLQELLTAAGYPLDADGVFGAKTEAAVKAFQTAHGLTADGVCGAKTWAALEPDGIKPEEPDTPDEPAGPIETETLQKIRDYAQAIIDAVDEMRMR